MQRKRSGVYNTGPSVSQHRTSFFGHDSGYFGSRNSAKDLFSDFRVEMDREIASKHFNHPAYQRKLCHERERVKVYLIPLSSKTRLLARIRDEFNTYVDITSRKSPVKSSGKNASKSWCACGQDVFEFALVRQENVVLKKRVSCMQQEIENLQAALEKAKMVDRNNDCPEDDIAGDELDSIQLFPAEDVNIQYCRPQIVPMLSFASLPAYEDDDEEEGLDEEEYMQ
ncbi:hypothetical protein PHYBOEH_005094 [Phytophthora boehmeriae]|uniref:Uncharacterized protein n=1 Tax=Phytophthora boehmeriae TaxID=109152 RepID=A0A8T1X4L5_9STRA|nr:hypothetical protein PHYBOEH_005094 [Phytophthora boehmeriae]